MTSKRSKRSRKDKRNQQKATPADEIAMKLEQCEIPDTIDTVIEVDTVIDGVMLEDPVPAVTPPRASCIPVLCRAATTGSARSYASIRRVSQELLPSAAGARPSRIPRWAAAASASCLLSSPVELSPSPNACSVAPDQTDLSFDDSEYGQHNSMSSASSLSSVEDSSCYATEHAITIDDGRHGIKTDMDLVCPVPGGPIVPASATVPE